MTINYDVNRWLTGETLFTAPIDCARDALRIVRLRLAVEWAIKNNKSLTGASLAYANLSKLDLSGLDLSDACLAHADMIDADLSGACLDRSVMRDADIRNADLRGADIRDADLRDADLRGADMMGADLRGADLRDADMRGADLRDADMRGANMEGVDLYGANMAHVDMTRAFNAPRIIDGGLRSDGYRFMLINGRVRAGCRDFTFEEARKHWSDPVYLNKDLAKESLAIVEHMVALARMRWPDNYAACDGKKRGE